MALSFVPLFQPTLSFLSLAKTMISVIYETDGRWSPWATAQGKFPIFISHDIYVAGNHQGTIADIYGFSLLWNDRDISKFYNIRAVIISKVVSRVSIARVLPRIMRHGQGDISLYIASTQMSFDEAINSEMVWVADALCRLC